MARILGSLMATVVLFLMTTQGQAQYGHRGYWGKLNTLKTGKWARHKVMRKGYLSRLINKVAWKHGTYARLLRQALNGLNAQKGLCKRRWPNFRMALANLAAGARRGAGTALAGPLAGALRAIQSGCAMVGKGGIASVVRALRAAKRMLRGLVTPYFMKKLRTAIRWMKKGNLWQPVTGGWTAPPPPVHRGAYGKFWGHLKPWKAGKWARRKVMRRGYLGRLINKVAWKHPTFSRMLRSTLLSLNGQRGFCKRRWPNFRMALANLARGARYGARAALAGPLSGALRAIREGCALVGRGGMNSVVTHLKAAHRRLRGLAKRGFMKHLRRAIKWMRKGILWR